MPAPSTVTPGRGAAARPGTQETGMASDQTSASVRALVLDPGPPLRGACPWAGRRPDPRDRRSIEETRRDLAAWIAKWSARYQKLVAWVEESIEETLTFYRLPRQHHKHLKSTNMLERLSEEIRRRTYVVRIFPNAEACLRLVRALAVETHENWLEAHRYLNMNDLKEHKKTHLRQAA